MNKKSDLIIRSKSRKGNRRAKNSSRRTVIVASALSVVCVAAMAGIYTMETKNKSAKESLVNWADTASTDSDKVNVKLSDELNASPTPTVGISKAQTGIENNFSENTAMLEQEIVKAAQQLDAASNASAQLETNSDENTSQDVVGGEAAVAAASKNVDNAPALSFNQTESLVWPVEGSILLDYSMEATTYFPTLDQYKYNPAIVIQAEEGCNVAAAASGIVEAIENSDETGVTVTMDIGSGYKLVYGQLKSVDYSTGKYIEKGETVGVIAQPTKYYSVEGSNLYFEMINNNEPINPVSFLKEGSVNE